jgi:RNA polymerase sigma-70 factor, ECF subfamily
MEPSTRYYNPNGPGEPRKRATRTSKRAGGSRSRAADESTADAGMRSQAEPAVPQTLAVVAAEVEQEQTLAADAGPVVGIDDFEEIFTRFQTPITNFVFRLVGNREQAYDLTQDVFVKAYRALSSGTTIQAAALSSWLYRIASNTATDALRRRRLISWLPLSLFNEDRGVGAGMPGSENPNPQQPTAEENLSAAAGTYTGGYDGGRFEQRVADREIVESVLKKLPPKYATCLLLYEHEGFSCAEIAEVLSVSPSAVKMRLMRARERFIQLYRQETGGQ